MNPYQALVGQSFVRSGMRYIIVACNGVTVTAAARADGRRVQVPLADALQSLDVPEISVDRLPEAADHTGQ